MFYGIFLFFLIQRLSEMVLAKKNLRLIQDQLLAAVDENERKTMILLHGSWFIALLVEFQWHGELLTPPWVAPAMTILVLCQMVRFWTMLLLKESWVPFPVAHKNQKICDHGPYRWIRHPNYLIVMIEIPLVALTGGCFVTAFVYGVLNFAFLQKRIRIEEGALNALSDYQGYRMKTKKLLPFLFSLFLVTPLFADSMTFKHKDFEAAKNSSTYFKFTGSSKKLGLITTEFDGFAREGRLEYQRDQKHLKEIKLSFAAASLDTDNSSRNEKMLEKCLEAKTYPEISITAPQIDLSAGEQTVDALMTIRGKSLPLKLKIYRDGNLYRGETTFKLSEAGIPDPSIAIASVKDEFVINFQVEVTP